MSDPTDLQCDRLLLMTSAFTSQAWLSSLVAQVRGQPSTGTVDKCLSLHEGYVPNPKDP